MIIVCNVLFEVLTFVGHGIASLFKRVIKIKLLLLGVCTIVIGLCDHCR